MTLLSGFLQLVTVEFCNKQQVIFYNKQFYNEFLQRETSATSNNRILQRVTSDFLKQATSATSNERISLRVTSDFTTSNEQRVKDYTSWRTVQKNFMDLCSINKYFVNNFISVNECLIRKAKKWQYSYFWLRNFHHFF